MLTFKLFPAMPILSSMHSELSGGNGYSRYQVNRGSSLSVAQISTLLLPRENWGEVAETTAFSYAFFGSQPPAPIFSFTEASRKVNSAPQDFPIAVQPGLAPVTPIPQSLQEVPVTSPLMATELHLKQLTWRDKERTKSPVSSISVSRGMTGWCALWILRLAGSRNVC